MSIKVITVVGARPQFVKAAVVSRAVAAHNAAHPDAPMEEQIVHTGQHFDEQMSDVFFEEMQIPRPHHQLGIGGMGHGAMTGRMLEGIEQVLLAEKPDWVLVYGDTNSTMAGALAAVKLHIPLAHVEAGLRSFNRRMPEEINRVVTDHVSTLLFAPTEVAVTNLRNEGLGERLIRRTGDVMYDAALFYAGQARARSTIMADLGLEPRGFVLSTIHRAENTDRPERLAAILDGLGQVAERLPVVLPVHPRTRGVLERQGLLASLHPRLRLLDPVGYFDMVMLEENARLVATDSGGVQKEAYFFGVPCVTLRDETEWLELVTAGANRLTPPVSAAAVATAVFEVLDGGERRFAPGLYGEGRAGEQIVAALREVG